MFTNKIKTVAMAAIILAFCVSNIVSQRAAKAKKKSYVDDSASAVSKHPSNALSDDGAMGKSAVISDGAMDDDYSKYFEYDIGSKGVVIKKYTGNADKVEIPATIKSIPVTEIGEEAFYDCIALTSITIPEGVTKIGNGAFYNCSALTSVTIPEGVTKIGEAVFCHCSALTSVTIPESVTEISAGTFAECSALKSVKIPASVEKINFGVFDNCESLTAVEFGSEKTVLVFRYGYSPFDGCSSLPPNVKEEIEKHPKEEYDRYQN